MSKKGSARKDISGAKFGDLTAIRDIGRFDQPGSVSRVWECECICGQHIAVPQKHLVTGNTKSCGCRKKRPRVDLIGKKFGMLSVVEFLGSRPETGGSHGWRCVCDCGNEKVVSTSKLNNGGVKSCGCLRARKNAVRPHREYNLRRNYRIGEVEYDIMFMSQSGLCAICQEPSEHRLHVDHDRKTGMLRDLLCLKCNPGIGYFNHDIELLKKAIAYLEHWRLRGAA